MKEFCRTCGRRIETEHCLQLFSREARQLLHCVRSITNCWLQNAAEFPCHLCEECQRLLRQVQSFRRRCAKIENFLSRRRTKLELAEDPAPVELPLPAQPDPLGLDELMPPSEIKEEPEQKGEEANNTFEGDFPIPAEESNDIKVAPQDRHKVKAKSRASKQTMRLGRKLIHVKVIDDKQPKRIVDRNGQTAKPCICEHCGRQFKDTSNLHVHLLRHTGTKPFECEQCHQKCYTLHLLRRHQLKHTEGPYACTFCGLEYSTNSSRVRHEREACKKGRAPQSKWEIIKKGERTFHCEVCDLWFLRAGNFTQHINSSSHVDNERRKMRKTKLDTQKNCS
ncbi:hypothetical protein KR018_012311 [Drosophila ironensis]|nr:hypothetical protein KR018_012311 [Drosophila ironensis]